MKAFPGKLILFGEYTVLKGGQALALPLFQYSGRWVDDEPRPAHSLQPFLAYLQQLQRSGQLQAPLQLQQMEADLAQGLSFHSNIPVGYGAGSSGAVCAGVYERYAQPAIAPDAASEYAGLRAQLAQLESYFHGNSSGTDPFISYVQQPVLMAGGQIEVAGLQPVEEKEASVFFLMDTGQPRETAPLVERFLSYYEQPVFQQAVEGGLLPAAERAVQHYLSGARDALAVEMALISELQLQHFAEWIPEAALPFWRAGLDSGNYALKLCGAGGGGFLLGYGKREWWEQQQQAGLILLQKT